MVVWGGFVHGFVSTFLGYILWVVSDLAPGHLMNHEVTNKSQDYKKLNLPYAL